jgi:hypothetical protein
MMVVNSLFQIAVTWLPLDVTTPFEVGSFTLVSGYSAWLGGFIHSK